MLINSRNQAEISSGKTSYPPTSDFGYPAMVYGDYVSRRVRCWDLPLADFNFIAAQERLRADIQDLYHWHANQAINFY